MREEGREGGREGRAIPPLVVSVEDVHPEVEHARTHAEGRPEAPGIDEGDDDIVFAAGTGDEKHLEREGGC